MSCNGCRVLRKGCSHECILRQCIEWIDGADEQAHATVFVAKFFGRATLMSFLASVTEPQRPALFHSLLYEACGRTISPVTGAVGLLWTGNWHLCQEAVQTVLHGGTVRPLIHLGTAAADHVDAMELLYGKQRGAPQPSSSSTGRKRPALQDGAPLDWRRPLPCDLDLCLTPTSPERRLGESKRRRASLQPSSLNSDDSTTSIEGAAGSQPPARLLNLFI